MTRRLIRGELIQYRLKRIPFLTQKHVTGKVNAGGIDVVEDTDRSLAQQPDGPFAWSDASQGTPRSSTLRKAAHWSSIQLQPPSSL